MTSPYPCGLLFDFDGVIADSSSIHQQAWSSAYNTLFGQELGEAQAVLHFGLASSEISMRLARYAGQSHRAQALYTLKLEHLLQGPPPAMLPGVEELMRWCRVHNVPYGIVSNAPTTFVRQSIESFQLNVPCVMGLDDVSAPKPSSAPYLELAHKLRIPKHQHAHTWVLEDSITGIQAGTAANMYVVGITSQHDPFTLEQAGASKVCASCLSVYEHVKTLA